MSLIGARGGSRPPRNRRLDAAGPYCNEHSGLRTPRLHSSCRGSVRDLFSWSLLRSVTLVSQVCLFPPRSTPKFMSLEQVTLQPESFRFSSSLDDSRDEALILMTFGLASAVLLCTRTSSLRTRAAAGMDLSGIAFCALSFALIDPHDPDSFSFQRYVLLRCRCSWPRSRSSHRLSSRRHASIKTSCQPVSAWRSPFGSSSQLRRDSEGSTMTH